MQIQTYFINSNIVAAGGFMASPIMAIRAASCLQGIKGVDVQENLCLRTQANNGAFFNNTWCQVSVTKSGKGFTVSWANSTLNPSYPSLDPRFPLVPQLLTPVLKVAGLLITDFTAEGFQMSGDGGATTWHLSWDDISRIARQKPSTNATAQQK